tara:strand:- start:285 stop:587 length:303 start_codon:yes stop_codon:yes gene_type:complete
MGNKTGKGRRKITSLEEREDAQIDLIKSHMFDNLDFMKDIKLNPQFYLDTAELRINGTWEKLLFVANYFHIDISDFHKLRDKVGAMSKIKKVLKARKEAN